MISQNIALVAVGVIGGSVAVVHGVLTQRLMAGPVAALMASDKRIAAPIQNLVPPLLQFSTYNWFLGGLALIAAALWLERDARLVAAALVGSSYLFGAVINFWGTRGRHPGWVLMAAALVLIVYGVGAPG